MLDHDGHSADSSLRRHGPPADSQRAAAGTSAASSPSRRSPNNKHAEKSEELYVRDLLKSNIRS